MKKAIRDGWHKICGYEVYVENGFIVQGLSSDDWRAVPTYPYRKSRQSGWDSVRRISVSAFRAGVNRGTIIME